MDLRLLTGRKLLISRAEHSTAREGYHLSGQTSEEVNNSHKAISLPNVWLNLIQDIPQSEMRSTSRELTDQSHVIVTDTTLACKILPKLFDLLKR